MKEPNAADSVAGRWGHASSVKDQPICEWPRSRSETVKCGVRAKVYVLAPGHEWGRWVCGTHFRRAVNIGWVPNDGTEVER